MMQNDNIEVVHQHQMVVAWIRLRQMKKLKETKLNNLPHKNSKLFLIKILVIVKMIKNDVNNKINNDDYNDDDDNNNNDNNNNNNNNVIKTIK